ncbi:MAG: GGDEF domain-containing protein [Planctomycetota bacterium]|jgi:diguanylate cyclase (GGDEF)-like protein|nr:GGDEF domain-containing protein [Planctomycetota bacterium]
MTFGLGVLLGALVGAASILLIVAIFTIINRPAKPAAVVPDSIPAPNPPPVDIPAGHDTIDHKSAQFLENQQQFKALGKTVNEMRGLMVKVSDIITSTSASSDAVSKSFSDAKSNLDSMDTSNFNDNNNLMAVHDVLILQLNNSIASNEKLQNELVVANQGLAEQQRVIDELRQAVRIDSMTQLNNRAAFSERLAEISKHYDRTNESFALLMLDIDYFKRINDAYGHVNGDRILKGVANKIKDSIRGDDFAARYGGEEFVVIFPCCDLTGAHIISERIRKNVANTVFSLDNLNLKITISGGLAQVEKTRVDRLIEDADNALYVAKNSGRNRVNLFKPTDSPVEEKAKTSAEIPVESVAAGEGEPDQAT